MRKWLGLSVCLVVIAGLFGVTRVATAATFTYPSGTCPAGGTGLSDCITNASAGDVIKIKPGTYYENVLVDEDVTVKAKDCTKPPLFDAAADGAGNPDDSKGVGFEVASNGVTIDCVRIRHATEGVSIGTGTGFDNVTIRRISTIDADNGVYIDNPSNNVVVKDSLFRLANQEQIRFFGGTGFVASGNRCENIGSDCMDISNAPGAQIVDNFAKIIDDGGLIEMFSGSHNAVISRNKVGFSDSESIQVFGGNDNVEVSDNVIKDGGETAIEVNSSNLRVTGNRAIGHFEDDAFDLQCSHPCTTGLVQGNILDGSAPDDDEAFEIDGTFVGPLNCPNPPCLRILDNISGGASEDGFDIAGHFIEIKNNTTSNNGESDGSQGYGFYLDVSTSTVVQNSASNNAVDGFRISGDDNTISDNVSKANAVDGFDVQSGEDNLLDGNVAKNNHGDGIDNHTTDGSGTDLTNNVSSGNRVDCTNSGTIDVNTGNTCADGSNFANPSSIE